MDTPPTAPSKTWGGSRAIIAQFTAVPWPDVLIGLALIGGLLALFSIGSEFGKQRTAPVRQPFALDLAHLGLYTLFSLGRGVLAYGCSLVFAISYGYWAARDRIAEKLLLPLLHLKLNLLNLPLHLRLKLLNKPVLKLKMLMLVWALKTR